MKKNDDDGGYDSMLHGRKCTERSWSTDLTTQNRFEPRKPYQRRPGRYVISPYAVEGSTPSAATNI